MLNKSPSQAPGMRLIMPCRPMPGDRRTGGRDAREMGARGLKDTLHAIRPRAWQVVLGMIAFAAPWLWLLERSTLAPPTDNIEQLTWVRSLEWGYYKHPPLPTWLLWPFVQALGWSAWTTYVLGALCTLGGFFIYWRMLRGMRGGAYALVALLAGLCVTFYNGRLHFYNHEIPLITFVAGGGRLLARLADAQDRLVGGAGPVPGPGRAVKYQAAVAALCVFVFWLSQRGWRDPMQVFGLQVAALTALAVFFPHLYWLIEHNFEPLGYAMSSSLGGPVLGRAFARSGALVGRPDPEPRIAGLGLAGRPVAGHAPVASGGSPGGGRCRARCGARPAARVRAGAAAVRQHDGPGLRRPCAAALGHALSAVRGAGGVELAGGGAWTRRVPPRAALVAFLVVQAALMLRMALVAPTGGAIARKPDDWRYFDSRALAEALHAPAMRALGGPVRLVSGRPPRPARWPCACRSGPWC